MPVTDPNFFTGFQNGTFEGTPDPSEYLGNAYGGPVTRIADPYAGTYSYMTKVNLSGLAIGAGNSMDIIYLYAGPGKNFVSGRSYTFQGKIKLRNRGAIPVGRNIKVRARLFNTTVDVGNFADNFGTWLSFTITAVAISSTPATIQFEFVNASSQLTELTNAEVAYDDFGAQETSPSSPLIVTYTKTDVTSFGGTNGSIDVTVSGGSGGPYTYLWSDGATTQDRNYLSAGSYNLTVTDATAGVTKTITVQINEPNVLTVSYVKTDATTNGGSDGTITLTVTGGSGNYTYVWSDGPTTKNRSGLIAGVYSVNVTDAVTGEVRTVSITILQPDAPPKHIGTFIEVPFMNSLHFVTEQTIDQCDNPQALDNVLLKDQYFPGFLETDYTQKVCKCDAKLVQFNSDFNTFSIGLYKYCNDELVKNFSFQLKEENMNVVQSFPITVRNHTGFPGKSRIYFNVGAPPIPLQVGDVFTILNNLDGFNGRYAIVDIVNDTLLGYQYLVINKNYGVVSPNSNADGEFKTSTVDFNVFESALTFLDVANGEYYVRITGIDDVGTVFKSRSEPIDLQVEHPGTNEIIYRNFDNAFNMTWTTGYIGSLRVESLIGHKRNPGGERSISRNSDYSVVKIAARKTRGIHFETFMLPMWLHEKLSVIFDLDFYSINGVQFQSTEGYSEPQYVERFLLANSSIKLEQVGWFDQYNSDDIGTITETGFLTTEEGFLKI